MKSTTDIGLIARYIPDLVLQRLADNPDQSRKTRDERFKAAVLFADISGFTKLTESLAAKGSGGVEELTRILNAYFGQVIERIRADGGDIIKFAGDALLAFWMADEGGGLTIPVRRSAQCALELQEALQSFEAPGGVKLSLRVSIAAGEVRSLHIGGRFDRWEFVVAGQPLGSAGTANDQAERGEVALAPEAWLLSDGFFDGEPRQGGCVKVSRSKRSLPSLDIAPRRAPPELAEAVEAYIPGAVRERIRAGQSAWLAELRRLTVLFVNLPELHVDVPLEQAQRAMALMQDSLYAFEGSVNKLSVDDKGVTLVGALGMPPLSHFNDPERGLGAALLIHENLNKMGWRHSIGVTTGRTFCGSIGNETRCEYTVIGDVVNLSARLMQAAKGGILCDAATYEAARGRFEFEDLESIQVKGKKDPIKIYRPLIERATPAPAHFKREVIVGRDLERRVTASVLAPVPELDDAPLVIIEGDTGMGKSSLVLELAMLAGEAELCLLRGAGDAIESSTPYRAWRTVFQILIDELTAKRSGSVVENLQQLLGDEPELVKRLPLISIVAPFDIPENDLTEELAGEARAINTRALLVALLRRGLARRPMTLVLDDAQWFDSASFALLEQVTRELPRLPLALLTRPFTEAPPPLYTALKELKRTRFIKLEPFAAEETGQLVKARLALDKLPPEIESLIFEKSQGNPLFSVELAYSVRDSGYLEMVTNKGRSTSSEIDASAIIFPETVQGVVTARIDRLAPREQLVLKVASAIGRRFSIALLHDIYPIVEDRAHHPEALATLCSRELLGRTISQGAEPEYIFKHVVTREVAYSLMPGAQRSQLHRAIAEWYERRISQDPEGLAPLLGEHWAQAGEPARALAHFESAGATALRGFANAEALTFYRRVLSLSEGLDISPERRSAWLCALAEAVYRLGDLAAALSYFRQGLLQIGLSFPENALGMLLATVFEFLKQTVYRLRPAASIGKARDDERPRLLAGAAAYERLAQIRYLNNAKVPTLHAAFKGLNLSERAGSSPELARSYANAAVCNGLLMLHGIAQAHTERANRVAEDVKERPCSAYVEFINGVYWVTVGKWEDCGRALETAVQLGEETGDRRRWDESLFTLVNARAREGRFDESRELAEKLAESALERGVPQVTIWGLGGQLWARAPKGVEGPEVGELLAKLAETLEDKDNVPLADQIFGFGLGAFTHQLRGELEQAEAMAASAFEIYRPGEGVSHYILEASAALVDQCVAALKDAEGPRRKLLLSRAKLMLKGLGEFALMYPFGQARRRLGWGRYYAALGKTSAARRLFRKSLASSIKLRMPYEEALARSELARLDAQDPDGNARAAREILERLGAAREIRVIERASAR